MRAGWIGIAALVLACGGEQHQEAPAADVVATFDGGTISLSEIEQRTPTARTPACLTVRRAAGGASLELLLPCYREVAEALTLERLVLAETPDVNRAIEGLGERYHELRRQAFLNPYYRRFREEIEVSDEEVETHFAENQESYRQSARLTLWNIFRRHQDDATPEETDAFLAGLKERYLAGEPFGSLARQYSQSETRLRDGLVGPISLGKLPPRLEELAFALGEGEVSDPIRVRGGAVLLHVRNVVDSTEPGIETARARIRQEIVGQKIEERVAQRIAGREPPEGSVAMEPAELFATLDDEDPDLLVSEIAGQRLTSGELRRLAGFSASTIIGDEDRERILEVYRRQTQQQLLLIELLESADADVRREAEEHMRERGLAELVDEQLRAEILKLVDSNTEQLRQYYEDNRTHYQNPLRVKLLAWDLPFGDDPPRQLGRMEELQGALSAGEIDLAAAAGRLGGDVRDLGWRDFEGLVGEIPNKAHTYLLQIEAGGFSVPYQQDDALHILHVAGREEPRPLEYEEVTDQVRQDFFNRFQQRLYSEVAQGWLTTAGFKFHEDDVRRLLVQADSSS